MILDASTALSMGAIAMGAGLVGSLLGLGGGFILVPALTLIFEVDLRAATGASLIAVIATSSGASITYLKKTYANLELASFLEISTVIGAVLAVFVAPHLPTSILYVCLALILIFASASLICRAYKSERDLSQDSLPLASTFFIEGTIRDDNGNMRHYRAKRLWWGFAVSGFAGVMSGLLGIGGGVIKVPTMNVIMGVPLKAAAATSNLMMGMTAATTALLLYTRGELPLSISAVVAIGVFLGARVGARSLHKVPTRLLSWIFLFFALFLAVQLMRKGLMS